MLKRLGGGYNLIFAGSLLKGYVEADYIIKLFSDDKMLKFNLKFYSAGSGSESIKQAGLKNMELIGWVPRNKLEDAYRHSDAFISIAEKSGKQISSKIFEYMSYGKPIIHIYYSDNDENLRYLRAYANSLCIKADLEKIEINRNLIIMFLIFRIGVIVNCHEQNILMKCTPEYITNQILKEIEI